MQTVFDLRTVKFEITTAEIIAGLVPPPHFAGVSFENYIPDPFQPSQADALLQMQTFADSLSVQRKFWQRRTIASRPGKYLDGGFGVGKTHLLAALWNLAEVPKAFGTFVEFTNLVGLLGFEKSVQELSQFKLICIDEFELDDPGDTVLMSTLLMRLVEQGVKLAATSNTLPDRLGQERFAAEDFIREIQGLANHFDTIRIDGEDYRHRGLPTAPHPASPHAVEALLENTPPELENAHIAQNHLAHLNQYLASLHPSKYQKLVKHFELLILQEVFQINDQAQALRLVVFIDRLYDLDIPVIYTGIPLEDIFSAELMRGGYRKKYRRAVSRIVALSRLGERYLRP